jgi:deoxyxylulose-5-phosphate synthase
MGHLESITTPRDLRDLSDDQLDLLASEIRDLLVATCSRTGGHLGPNLGVVELTLAIHRVFDSPRDRVVFDTGHQTYVHKLLTGRREEFDRLRQEGGLSGYPSQDDESSRRWIWAMFWRLASIMVLTLEATDQTVRSITARSPVAAKRMASRCF